jgi:Flp pilus assembly protein TadD
MVLGATALVAAVSWLAWRARMRRPWLLFGWAWFLGTLLPVLGLVQVGAQSIADRYTYVPLLGIFTIGAWSGAEFLARPWRIATAAVVLVAGLVATIRAIPAWQDPLTLVAQMRSAIGEHFIVYRELGTALQIAGHPQEEIDAAHRRGAALAPDYPYFLNELGISAGRAGRYDEARTLLERVRHLLPDHPDAEVSLAGLALGTDDTAGATGHLRRALALRPRHAAAHRLLAQVFVKERRFPEARDELLEAVRADRWDWVATNELGVVQNHLDRPSEALACFERAHWINPGDGNIRTNLRALRQRLGRGDP